MRAFLQSPEHSFKSLMLSSNHMCLRTSLIIDSTGCHCKVKRLLSNRVVQGWRGRAWAVMSQELAVGWRLDRLVMRRTERLGAMA
jgi:hypothetical protein